MLQRNAIVKELGVLKVMEGKHQQDREDALIKINYPNKYLDVELNYMKQIRDTYFVIKEDDIEQQDNTRKSHLKAYEISDSITKLPS